MSDGYTKEARIFFVCQSIAVLILVSSIIVGAATDKTYLFLIPIIIFFLEIVVFIIGARIYIRSEEERKAEMEAAIERGDDLIMISYNDYRKLLKDGHIEKDGKLISIDGAVREEMPFNDNDIEWRKDFGKRIDNGNS